MNLLHFLITVALLQIEIECDEMSIKSEADDSVSGELSASTFHLNKRIVFEALTGDTFLQGHRKLARALYSAFEKSRKKDMKHSTFTEEKRPLWHTRSNFDVLMGGGLG
uniref:BTB domain-containing protein n=1 Tax=Steinernema glaseri TaxID=37863 RepID=A0A1I7ZE50_9BILA